MARETIQKYKILNFSIITTRNSQRPLIISMLLIGYITSTLTLLYVNKLNAAQTLNFTNLGTLTQAAAQSSSEGKKLNTMTVFNGKVYAAYGDMGTNTGEITINPLDTSSGSFDGPVIDVPSEQLDNFKVINNKLYTTTIDPTCSYTCPAGFAVYSEEDGWEIKTPINAEHIFDIETLTGTDIWLFGSSGGDTATAWRSVDGGNNFTVVRSYASNPGVNNTERYYWGKSLNGKMYFQSDLLGVTSPLQIYNASTNTWSEGPTTGVCTSVKNDILAAPNPVNFANKIICPSSDGIELFDGINLTTKRSNFSFPNQMPACNTVSGDFTVYKNMLYVLCGNNRNILKTSPEMRNWVNIGTAPTGAKSIAIDETNQMIYVGTSDSKIYRSSLLEDNINPSVTIDIPSDGQVFHESHIYASATSSDDEAIEKVEFYLGETLLDTDIKSPFAVNWENDWSNGLANIASGNYELTAKAFDISGNSTISDPVEIELVNDGNINSVYKSENVKFRGLAIDGTNTWSISYTKEEDEYIVGIAKIESNTGNIDYYNSSITTSYGVSNEAYLPGTPLALSNDGTLWFSNCNSDFMIDMISYDTETELFDLISTEQPCGSTDGTYVLDDGKIWNIGDYGALVIDTERELSYKTLSESAFALGSALDNEGNLIVQLVDFDTYAGQIIKLDLNGDVVDSFVLPEGVLGYSFAINPANNHIFMGNILINEGEIYEFSPDGQQISIYNAGLSGDTIYSVKVNNDSVWFMASNDSDLSLDRIGQIKFNDERVFSRSKLDSSTFSAFASGSDEYSMWAVNGSNRIMHFHENKEVDNDQEDSDGDGIPDSIENNGPNNGDANNDGILDSLQPNVSVIKNEQDNYIVIETSCASNSNTESIKESEDFKDSTYDYPSGLVAFKGLNCGDPGSTVDINLYYYGILETNALTLRKWNDTIYMTISEAILEMLTIDNQSVLHAQYKIVDGGELDLDEIKDGNIVDPVGLGKSVVGVPNTGIKQFWLLNFN